MSGYFYLVRWNLWPIRWRDEMMVGVWWLRWLCVSCTVWARWMTDSGALTPVSPVSVGARVAATEWELRTLWKLLLWPQHCSGPHSLSSTHCSALQCLGQISMTMLASYSGHQWTLSVTWCQRRGQSRLIWWLEASLTSVEHNLDTPPLPPTSGHLITQCCNIIQVKAALFCCTNYLQGYSVDFINYYQVGHCNKL